MDIQTVLSLVSAVLVILISFPVHEAMHAYTAYRLGDSTARWQGRISLDPRRHFDPLGGIVLLVSSYLGSFIGWAKPTPVNPYNLRYGRRGEALVALAGPASNLVIAAVLAVPLRLMSQNVPVSTTIQQSLALSIAWDVVWFFFLINCALAVFNLLPVPPLDGWKVLLGLVDARTSYSLRQYEQYAIYLLLVVFLVGGRFIFPIILWLADFLSAGARPILL